MKKINLAVLMIILFAAWSCKDEEPIVTTGAVSGKVTDAISDASLEGVRIIVFESNSNSPVSSIITGADGNYKTDLLPGSYYFKLYRQGYDQVPPKGMSPVPFFISVGTNVTKPYEMNPSQVQDGGYVKGKVSEAGKGVAGVLVVADKDSKGYSAVTDANGDYYIYNLPAGDYSLKGWLGGYTSEQQTVNISSSSESTKNITLTQGASGSVNGTVTFLASTEKEVDITLTHPLTREAIPGIRTTSSKNYSLSNVPSGTYIARASFQNDERVVDPDWIIKNGELLVTVANDAVSRNFSLTGSVLLSSPTNLPITTEPYPITSPTPTFSWSAYSSSSDYVIEVSDASGNIIWGGFSEGASGMVKNVTIPSSQTSVIFNKDGSAKKALEPGKVYRWKVYASKNDAKEATGWKLISVSEDQMGLIKISE